MDSTYCMDHFESLMKNIHEPKIRLVHSDVHIQKLVPNLNQIIDPCVGRENFDKENNEAIEDILSNFECLICKGIPIDPFECSECEVIFCFDCLTDHKKLTGGSNNRKCPYCKQNFQEKPLNKLLQTITID